MADDPYTELNVPRGASDDDVRRAYRKLAKEFHPDLNPDNRAASEARIKTVNAAFAILGDAEKRRQFDAGLIDGNGEPRQRTQRTYAGAGRAGPGAGTEEFGFGDIFSDLFGRGRGAGPGPGAGGFRGPDVRYTLEVDFLEAVNGAKKRVTMPGGGALDMSVPEGVADGQVLRLKGKGGESPRGGESGDALVEIKVRPHAEFRRTGDDILSTVPVTIDEAVLGGKIEVATIHGRVALTIPKGTSSGRAFRMKGRGVRSAPGQAPGDQIVTIAIVMPEEIDEKLAYFMAEWRRAHAYDPGRKS
jgi:DnaJ-class molecular chaperone